MIKELESAIERWLGESLDAVTSKKLISNHIDEILQKKIPATEWVDASVQAFRILVESLSQLHTPVKPMLIIPLEDMSRRISQAIPKSMEEAQAQLTIEPPSLYLIDWESAAKTEAVHEEFNAPLPFKLTENLPDKVYVYYRESRSGLHIEANEKFMRYIGAEFFPLGLYQ